jgi:hypothetical protein
MSSLTNLRWTLNGPKIIPNLGVTRYGNASHNGAVLYQGPSKIQPDVEIVVIVTGLRNASSNTKTGPLLQTHILVADDKPTQAVVSGLDSAVCGGCMHRRRWNAELQRWERSCYVNIGKAQNAIWTAFQNGSYPDIDWDVYNTIATGLFGRLGTYGDPASVPIEVWDNFVKPLSGWTGYTHQSANPRLREVLKYCQVSADSLGDAQASSKAGLGSFRVLGSNSPPKQDWEILCPASEEAGKTVQCHECLMCDGKSGNNIVIGAHGTGGGYAQESNRRPLKFD